MNEFYDAGLITLGAVVVSFASRKVLKDGLGVPTTANGVMKLVAAVGLSSMGVHYLQVKKFLPDDPFKS